MKDQEKFEKWLQQQGCEILPLSSEYELVRFRGREVGVIYKSGKFSGTYASRALSRFPKWKSVEWSTPKYRKKKIL